MSRPIDQYKNLDYSGNPAYIKNNAHSEITSFRGGISHNYNFNKSVSNTTTVFGSGVSNNASSAGGSGKCGNLIKNQKN